MDEPSHADPPDDPFGLDDLRRPSNEQDLTLNELSAAFAEMLSVGDDPYPDQDSYVPQQHADTAEDTVSPIPSAPAAEVSPRSILEALLFVGNPQNAPVRGEAIAALMRGVRAAEIDDLVDVLNRDYAAENAPYVVQIADGGYRLALREEYAALAEKLQGRRKQVRLSPAAVEVLALVAYEGPLSAHDVSILRGAQSGQILTQLVRRQLLRLERSDPVVYHTTPRFLELLGIEDLADLPRSEDHGEK